VDERLRKLEREARDGDPAQRARYLLECVRAGRFERGRLQLAAYLGDPGARQALGEDAPIIPRDLALWIDGLAAWENVEVVARSCAALCRMTVEFWRDMDPTDECGALSLLTRFEVWILAPCEVTNERLIAAAVPVWQTQRETKLPPLGAATTALLASASLARDEGRALKKLLWEELGQGLQTQRLLTDPARRAAIAVRECLGRSMGPDPDAAIRAAIARELIPWVLGEGDPLRG